MLIRIASLAAAHALMLAGTAQAVDLARPSAAPASQIISALAPAAAPNDTGVQYPSVEALLAALEPWNDAQAIRLDGVLLQHGFGPPVDFFTGPDGMIRAGAPPEVRPPDQPLPPAPAIVHQPPAPPSTPGPTTAALKQVIVLNWNATPPGANLPAPPTTGLHAADVIAYVFDTPSGVSRDIGNFSLGEVGGGAVTRRAVLSRVPGDLGAGLVAAEATAPTLPFTIGTRIAGIATLEPNTRYYVNVATIENVPGEVNLDASIKKPRGL